VLHDTTSMIFGGKRAGLGRVESGAAGFFLHASLAVTTQREPLGVIAAETWARTGKKRGSKNQRKRRLDPKRESLRWWRGIARSEAALSAAGGRPPVHVMDREGDNYDLYSELHAKSVRFIARLAHNRNIIGSTDGLKEVAVRGACLFQREVYLSRRAKALPYDRKRHPERVSRYAQLEVSAMTVEVRRSTNFVPGCPPSLSVNVVTVKEINPPTGVDPICWHLVTGEPVGTQQQIEFVVDAYRARWTIEEYFKALKTGCQFEKRQLESYDSLLTALAIFLPIAVRLLALRSAVRKDPDAECAALSARQIHLLRLHTSRPIAAPPTNHEVSLALAAFGGHLRSNGPPGWLVLWRGLERLVLLEEGWNDCLQTAKDVIDG
jgi:hypothetical protein